MNFPIKRFAACLLTLLLPSVRVLADGATERPAVVFVSIPPQAWLVKRLAGEAAEVQTLLPPGANPHTYEPSARQIRKLSEASLYLTVGIPFEKPMAARAGRLNAALSVAAMDAGLQKRGAHEHDHAGAAEAGHDCLAGGDPHVWLSPRLLCAMASNTVAALARALPQRQPALAAALETTVAEIRATDAAARAALRELPVRTWVVYHPSWGYFADEYGLTLLAVEEDGKAPSARHLAEVIAQAQAAGVKTVFTEPQYDRRPAETLARQVGARVAVIDPLQEDWPALIRDVAEKLSGRQPPSAAVGRR
ncbi:MAG TPA: zinc ABC transporter substrate-binding protein [Kiritimatiellia bacterium]|nr:zinc ABC transporter substrate-binding protein [Kiritimatiellia bacterium]HPS07483.1 zinc ABC transporter substrate-binding protein [Kiritimatiellia bacterium]